MTTAGDDDLPETKLASSNKQSTTKQQTSLMAMLEKERDEGSDTDDDTPKTTNTRD